MKKESEKPKEEADPVLDREAYCGRLGHFIPYRYCLKPAQEEPCFKITDCWWQIFDVVEDLRSRLSPEAFEKIFKQDQRPNRMEGILNIVDALRKDDPLK
jgi:hypothetical protein